MEGLLGQSRDLLYWQAAGREKYLDTAIMALRRLMKAALNMSETVRPIAAICAVVILVLMLHGNDLPELCHSALYE